MTEAEALIIAQKFVKEKEAKIGEGLAIVSPANQIEGGWVFYWNSSAYFKTRDIDHFLIGHGPLVILDDGRALQGGSIESPADVLKRFGVSPAAAS